MLADGVAQAKKERLAEAEKRVRAFALSAELLPHPSSLALGGMLDSRAQTCDYPRRAPGRIVLQ